MDKILIIPSGLGGIFRVKYVGQSNSGRHIVENVTNPDFEGSKYHLSEEQLNKAIEKTNKVNQSLKNHEKWKTQKT